MLIPCHPAGLAEIEKERQELLTKAVGKRDRSEGRARQWLARIPEVVTGYRGPQVQRALAVLAKPEVVEVACEATRRMLADGRITLVPNAERTAVAGLVHLRGLDQQMLEFAGFQRHVRNVVAGGRYELYSNYPLQIQAVAASTPQWDVLRSADRP